MIPTDNTSDEEKIKMTFIIWKDHRY